MRTGKFRGANVRRRTCITGLPFLREAGRGSSIQIQLGPRGGIRRGDHREFSRFLIKNRNVLRRPIRHRGHASLLWMQLF